MSEQQEEREIVQVTPRQSIEILLKSAELADKATDYKPPASHRQAMIFYDDGSQKVNDPTLYAYIEKAEENILERMKAEVIEEAGNLIRAELEAVKELLK